MALAQELGMFLLPEVAMPSEYAAGRVAEFEFSLEVSGADDVCAIPLDLTSGSKKSQGLLVWPVPQAKQFLAPPKIRKKSATERAAAAIDDLPQVVRHVPRDLEDALPSMPPYIRSLLRIKVTVAVKLAETHQPVRRILDLAPGSIIQFDKSCEDPLELMVGETCIAVGEAVKAGDKYGVRLTSMIMPEERFSALGKNKHAG
jgi:flagellar motor switch/type III secretory pathway protein FliN